MAHINIINFAQKNGIMHYIIYHLSLVKTL